MKSFISLALLIATVFAASSECLYCRNLDEGAGLLVTFSYCNQTDICLQNAWNYIQRDCNGGWQRGNSYELDFCNPNVISCPDFESSPEKFQIDTDENWSLSSGSSCIVKVDATNAVARVTFKNSNYLGIEWEGAKVDDVITIPEGEVAEIPIYNAADKGPLTFDITFSSASYILAAASAIASLLFSIV